jgi:hypothetical protein
VIPALSSPVLPLSSPFLSPVLSCPVLFPVIHILILFRIYEYLPFIDLYSALLARFSICPLLSSNFFSPHISHIYFSHTLSISPDSFSTFYSSFSTLIFPPFPIPPLSAFTSLLSLLLNHLRPSNTLTPLYLHLHLLPPYFLSLASVTPPPPITPQTWRIPTSKACLSMVDTDRTGGDRTY